MTGHAYAGFHRRFTSISQALPHSSGYSCAQTRYLLFMTLCLGLFLGLPMGWIVYTHRAARLDLTKDDDRYTAAKSIGIVPASGEIYAEGTGLVDQTIFYQAVVTPEEVAWLARTPEVSRLEMLPHAPLWWRFFLWWNSSAPDMRYFRTKDKWPVVYAYSGQKKLIYGTVEFD